jgi:hypothetical protein
LPACFGQSVIAGNQAGKDACAPRQFAITFSEEIRMADIHESKLEFETSLKPESWQLIGIINISGLKLMTSTPKQQ